jgi:hypothetical protein
MTPKAKAFSLYFKFYRDVIADDQKAKQCAIIAVDEIINAGKDVDEFSDSYWQQVKQEIDIEKL